jgi:hypothetical protein
MAHSDSALGIEVQLYRRRQLFLRKWFFWAFTYQSEATLSEAYRYPLLFL